MAASGTSPPLVHRLVLEYMWPRPSWRGDDDFGGGGVEAEGEVDAEEGAGGGRRLRSSLTTQYYSVSENATSH